MTLPPFSDGAAFVCSDAPVGVAATVSGSAIGAAATCSACTVTSSQAVPFTASLLAAGVGSSVTKGTCWLAVFSGSGEGNTWRQTPRRQLAASGSWWGKLADLPPSPLRPSRGRPAGAGASNDCSRRWGELWHLPPGPHPSTITILGPVRWPPQCRQPSRAAHGAGPTRCVTPWRRSPRPSVRTAHNGTVPPPLERAWPVRALACSSWAQGRGMKRTWGALAGESALRLQMPSRCLENNANNKKSHILSRGPPTVCHHCGQTLTIDHMLLECAVLQECRDEYYTVDSLNTLFQTIPETCIVEFLWEAGFFYLIWCSLLTSTSPQTWTIWSNLE